MSFCNHLHRLDLHTLKLLFSYQNTTFTIYIHTVHHTAVVTVSNQWFTCCRHVGLPPPGPAGGAPDGPGAGRGLDPGVQAHRGRRPPGARGVPGDPEPAPAAVRLRPQALQPLGARGGRWECPAPWYQAQGSGQRPGGRPQAQVREGVAVEWWSSTGLFFSPVFFFFLP